MLVSSPSVFHCFIIANKPVWKKKIRRKGRETGGTSEGQVPDSILRIAGRRGRGKTDEVRLNSGSFLWLWPGHGDKASQSK